MAKDFDWKKFYESIKGKKTYGCLISVHDIKKAIAAGLCEEEQKKDFVPKFGGLYSHVPSGDTYRLVGSRSFPRFFLLNIHDYTMWDSEPSPSIESVFNGGDRSRKGEFVEIEE